MTQPSPKPGNVTGTFDANGASQERIVNGLSSVLWIVAQLSVVCQPKQSGPTCSLYQNGVYFIDTSYFAGTGDTAGGDPETYLFGGDYILLDWSGGTPGGQWVCTYYYREVPL